MNSKGTETAYCETLPSWVRVLCYIPLVLLFALRWISRQFALLSWQVISLAYISMNQQKVNYPKINHEILQKDGIWAYDALNIMNKK